MIPLTDFIPFLCLRLYVKITEFHDEAWKLVVQIFRSGVLKYIQRGVALIISSHVSQCPMRTIQNVCPNENVTFWLFNSETIEPYQLIESNITNLQNAPFKPNTPIKILIHGYGGFRDHDPNPQIRPNYLALGFNVISIDYRLAARKPCYYQAIDAIDTVGRCLGEFVESLLKHNEHVNLKLIHVIGFSMGVHVGMRGGKTLTGKGIMLRRFTVLDAAAPMFYMNEDFTKNRCAEFIDAVHTNVGIYGKTQTVGDVDFYVNYLLFQRGCSILDISCNHVRAPLYFGESIVSDTGFWGYPLQSQDHLEIAGEYTPSTARGSYYLATNTDTPYATGYAFPLALDTAMVTWRPLFDLISYGMYIPIKMMNAGYLIFDRVSAVILRVFKANIYDRISFV